jgi:phosphoribosylformylglycinamidine synthase
MMAMTEEFCTLTIPGRLAFTSFQSRNLENSINALLSEDTKASSIRGIWVHYISYEGDIPSAQTLETLESLLDYGRPLPKNERWVEILGHAGQGRNVSTDPNSRIFYISPRPGTTSPWSSKATNIAKVCGLDRVKRMERGMVIIANFKGPVDPIVFTDVLHDRMTQVSLLLFKKI